MRILWLTWKDRSHPDAGGAEVVNEELAKRLVADGHQVTFLVAGFKNAKEVETKNGFKIIRLGEKFSKFTIYWLAYKYYKKNLVGWADLVIDEVNTIPFFAKFYVKENNILFVHQLAREIWFHQMFFPLSVIGYLLEPVYLWLLKDRKVITVSNSSKNDLLKYGFLEKNISIISEGIEIEPIDKLQNLQAIKKFENPTILSLGSVRPMKRTLEIVKAYELVKQEIPSAELVLAGSFSGRYANKVLSYIYDSKYKKDIKTKGKVTTEDKKILLQKSHALAVTSLKEGWGLVVTEAASQGTPSVVYDVDGLRDSVQNNFTGLICSENSPKNLAESLIKLINDKKDYETLRTQAWENSRKINFQQAYQDFIKCARIR